MATTLPATTAPQTDLDKLAEHYAFRRSDEVAAFVAAHPEVVGPLLDAVAAVPRYFGPNAPLVLEREYYPETLEDALLFAFIQVPPPIDTASAALERFDREWMDDAVQRANLKLMFDIEFVER